VSFLVVAVNVAIGVALAPRPRWPPELAARPARSGVARAAAAAALAGLAAGALGWAVGRQAPTPAGTVRVAVVQPGIVHQPEPRLRASVAATLALAPARPDLVVWGESSVGRDPASYPGDLAELAATARAVGAPLLVNVDARRAQAPSGGAAQPAPLSGAGGGTGTGIYKTSLLVGPDGPEGSYDKMRLVPFGEYVPLRPLFGWVTRFTAAAAQDRRRGARLEVLRAGAVTVGPVICFESAFPDLPRALAARGADLVVVQSATTTFQRTWGPDQHASLAAVRAVESGRPVVQAAISGVSAAFDADGRRLAWYPTGWRGAAVIAVPLARGETPYDRWRDWLPRACCGLLGLAALAALTAARSGRGGRPGPARPDAAPGRPPRRAVARSSASQVPGPRAGPPG
jgi:apolipoprotein N-acyltransferase